MRFQEPCDILYEFGLRCTTSQYNALTPFFHRHRALLQHDDHIICVMLVSCSLLPSFAQPAQRAVSVAALAAAGCAGLYFAAESGALASWDLPYLRPWQVCGVGVIGQHEQAERYTLR